MVMPNIGAFIAWGLITALFIEKGWLNSGGTGGLAANSWVAQIGGWGDFKDGGIVGPMITYLLPLLIGYTGGKNIYDVRGGVVGAIATMGVIAGTDIPMFMGAMIMGPLGGWTMKKIDAIWDGKIRPGFEMLVNNFSAGIWGMILALAGFFAMGPVVEAFSKAASQVVQFLVNHGLLPLTSILIEPAKILFLNNAINHGILTPLGTNEAVDKGKSILFLLEANPGPGLGLLLAFAIFGKGLAKGSAPGAAIIHFLGGIHEIYFPYVLMKPKLIAAVILGGMSGVFTNVLFGSGLRAPAAPGSIIAVLLQTANDSYVGVILSVIVATAVTFVVASLLLKTDRADDEGDLAAATAQMEANKGKKSSVASSLTGAAAGAGVASEGHSGPIHKIVFACDAGMGSSAMGASVLRRKVKAAGHDDVTVVNKAISTLSDEWDLVVTHQDLTDRARQRTGSAVHVSVDNFMNSPRYDEIVDLLGRTNGSETPAAVVTPSTVAAGSTSGARDGHTVTGRTVTGHADAPQGGVLHRDGIELSGRARTREEAIEEAGRLLVAQGAVDDAYVASMHERERSVSTYMGNLLAIPHGTNEAKSSIRRTALSFVRYADPVDWNGNAVKFAVGIAGAGDDHLTLLASLAQVFLDEQQVARLEAATSPEEVQEILSTVQAQA
ncbi:PTS mannitol transporter subunit IICBA [Arsenicicoccus cauae]|uniref:PTS mannitol transporter subunit IICBA n=1 Tax=Arsenicicoccus cauae TaxID=2663847 RepID=UPI00370D9151